jgi:predicted RNA binding protein YcfA (HicA-like mRNA interferase family)
MPKLKPLKAQEVIRKLKTFGVEGPFHGGKHSRMVHQERGLIIPIPMHNGKDVSLGLIRAIINEIGISREEWIKL